MNRRIILGVAGALGGLTLLAFTAGPMAAQTPPAATPSRPSAPGHEQMHEMMDAVHGAGASQRMHDAMGPEGERMMEQCAAMMGMMQSTDGMMGGAGMSGMMGGGKNGSMSEMMRQTMGR